MYLNKVQLIGNLTKDPELKALPSGNKVINFSIATNRTWKDQNGQKQEAVDYHNVVFYGKQAEVIGQWVFKGHQIYVEGRLTTRSWDDKDGKKQYRTEVVGEQFQFGSKPQGSSGEQRPRRSQADEDYDNYDKPSPEERKKINQAKGYDYPDDDINPEDIPF